MSKNPTKKETDDFIRRLILMKVEAGRLGLFATMHAIDAATTKVGYELADKLKKKGSK